MNHTCKQMKRVAWIFEGSSVQHIEGISGLVFLLFLLKTWTKLYFLDFPTILNEE